MRIWTGVLIISTLFLLAACGGRAPRATPPAGEGALASQVVEATGAGVASSEGPVSVEEIQAELETVDAIDENLSLEELDTLEEELNFG